MGLFHGTPRVFSSEGKLNMEASRLGSYVGGRRGLACFCLIWHASWLIDWGRAYGTAVFDWYVKAVVSVHPFAPKLDLKGISFVEYATVYFYVLAGLAPLFGIFCLVASFLHFRASSYGQNIRVSGLMMVANLVVFSAMIGGLAYLAYLDADGIHVPAVAAKSRYYFTGFGLMLFWGLGIALFAVLHISLCLAFRLGRRCVNPPELP